jgi:hypothetical protein
MKQEFKQREIKFRAWDLKNEQWYEGGWSLSMDGLFWYDDNEREWPVAGNLVIVQFTGRTDITPPWEMEPRKGANDLYEGDIVLAWTSRYPNSKTRGVIVWNDHAQAFQLRYENCFNGHANEFLHKYHFFERIGNIFQNPNLLNHGNTNT